MSLTLTVLSFKSKPINYIDAVVIGNNGGSVGRSVDNSLVLPDAEKFVSRHHAIIRFDNNGYYWSDTSLSGTYVNGDEKPLNNAVIRLENGTLLRVGEYEIKVTIVTEPAVDDFWVAPQPTSSESSAFIEDYQTISDLGSAEANPLMSDDFPRHEELVQQILNQNPIEFVSGLQGNQAPIFDSYIAPSIVPSLETPAEKIPENLSIDDLFSDKEQGSFVPSRPLSSQATVSDDFEHFFDAAISELGGELNQEKSSTDQPIENIDLLKVSLKDPLNASPSVTPPIPEQHPSPSNIATVPESTAAPNHLPHTSVVGANTATLASVTEKKIPETPIQAENVLFGIFLKGVGVECLHVSAEQQSDTLYRVGEMFRKLVEGTVSVLRSRAAFKSLCRVNMTVIQASNNNPLKFTVSTEDVLQQLLENKTDGFLASTTAIEEAFDDIMHHQLAMQAGIQASLTDLLGTFDPKVIEKQFEQGLVLQKKSKCWDKYEETYRQAQETAVENFFGEAFVKAYEQQMKLLKNKRNKSAEE